MPHDFPQGPGDSTWKGKGSPQATPRTRCGHSRGRGSVATGPHDWMGRASPLFANCPYYDVPKMGVFPRLAPRGGPKGGGSGIGGTGVGRVKSVARVANPRSSSWLGDRRDFRISNGIQNCSKAVQNGGDEISELFWSPGTWGPESADSGQNGNSDAGGRRGGLGAVSGQPGPRPADKRGTRGPRWIEVRADGNRRVSGVHGRHTPPQFAALPGGFQATHPPGTNVGPIPGQVLPGKGAPQKNRIGCRPPGGRKGHNPKVLPR